MHGDEVVRGQVDARPDLAPGLGNGPEPLQRARVDLVQITQGPPISSKRGSGMAGSIIEVAGRIIGPAIAYRPGLG